MHEIPKLKIATGSNRATKVWANIEMDWPELLKLFSQPTRTRETQAEFLLMPSTEADDIKDCGGFVMGHLKGGIRKKHFVICRSGLTIDLDYASPDLWEKVLSKLPYALAVYSTHKHQPNKPRLRVIIPFSREISEEEYEPISRMISRDIGINQTDPTTHQSHRLMYWPSCSSDGEFFFQSKEGSFLDPDEVFKRYEDWQDISSWPRSDKEKPIHQPGKKQADPLSKQGVIGAFCRTYSITDCIDAFLSDTYEPTENPDRYHYIDSHSSAGVVIYDDKFAYSNHAKDPACGMLLNSFDLCRVHRFGDLDTEASEKTPTDKLPSYKAMVDFTLADTKVKSRMVKERAAQVHQEFQDEDDWIKNVTFNSRKQAEASFENIRQILLHDPNLEPIVYNEFTGLFDVKGVLPWNRPKSGWNGTDMDNLQGYFENVYGLWSPGKVKGAFSAVISSEKAWHPVREYLNALTWDGINRLDTVLVDYLGAADTPYVRAVTRKTLVAAVARIYHPGIKFDSILTIIGDQSIGKSTLVARLGKDWFSDSLTIADMKDKTSSEKLLGNWVLELGELAGMKKVDVETIKSFITRTDDKYRAAYGVYVESHPRSCIIIGTTNSRDGFLRDITGNRRFWPVEVSGKGKYHPWDLTNPDQIWAEAVVRYQQGEDLFLSPELAEEAKTRQRMAMESDEREGMVQEYLETLLPSDWSTMDLGARRSFLHGTEFGSRTDGVNPRKTVSSMEIWCECFEKDRSDLSKSDSMTIISILSRLGWFPVKNEKGQTLRKRIPLYGPQRIYEKQEHPVLSLEDEVVSSDLLA